MTQLRVLGDHTQCTVCNQISIVPLSCTECTSYTCQSHLLHIERHAFCPKCAIKCVGECEHCGEENQLLAQDSDPDQKICTSCADDLYRCDQCLRYVESREINQDDHCSYCSDCFDSHYFRCDSCESIYHADDMRSDCRDSCLCNSCSESHYESCTECNPDLSNGNAETLQDHTIELKERGAKAILDYHPSISWEFFTDKRDNIEQCIGIELEIEHKNTSNMSDTCRLLARSLSNRILLTHDGSLDHTGYEIVLTPHTLHAYKSINWRKLLKDLSANGAISHDSENCGLHIHLSHAWFEHNDQRKIYNIAKRYQALFSSLQDLLVPFSRRTTDQINRYCSLRNQSNSSRYCAVNLSNSDTVEIRLWRGTLNFESFSACFDMTFAILDFTWSHPCAHRLPMSKTVQQFRQFLKTSRYHRLNKYLNNH